MTLIPARRPSRLSPRRLAPVVGPRRALRSVCLYTCSYNPSGMGAHMLALTEQYVAEGLDVSVVFWPAPAAEAMMSRAADLGARLVRTPHPRDPAYADQLTAGIRALRPDLVHVHVGTGREAGRGPGGRPDPAPAVAAPGHAEGPAVPPHAP